MKHKLIVDKSIVVNTENSKILISDLPEELQNEFATFDKIKQDRIDALYKLEIYELAFQTKQQLLLKAVTEWLSEKNKAPENE